MASAGARAYNGGLGAERGSRGTAPGKGSGGQAPPPEADGILVLEHTLLRSPGACMVAIWPKRPDRGVRTFDTAAILSVGLNDSLNGADVSHLEVLWDFLQVQSLDRCGSL